MKMTNIIKSILYIIILGAQVPEVYSSVSKEDWECAIPKVSYSGISIQTQHMDKLLKLNEMENNTIEDFPNWESNIVSFYNNLYGGMAELFSRQWFDNTEFSSQGGKTFGNQGYDGLYTLQYNDEFVVVNEVKYNTSRLTPTSCKADDNCKCGQLSRAWVKATAMKLVDINHVKYTGIFAAINDNNYCRSLIRVDTEGYMHLYKVEDKNCPLDNECVQIKNRESIYFDIVSAKLKGFQ